MKKPFSIGTKIALLGSVAAIVLAIPIICQWNAKLVGIVNAPDEIKEIRIDIAKMNKNIARIADHEDVELYDKEQQQYTNNSPMVLKTGKRTITDNE